MVHSMDKEYKASSLLQKDHSFLPLLCLMSKLIKTSFFFFLIGVGIYDKKLIFYKRHFLTIRILFE